METNQSTTNQSSRDIELQTSEAGSNKSLPLVVILSVLLTTMVVGLAVYLWQKSVNDKAISSLEQKIIFLEEQISAIDRAGTAPQPTSLPELSPTPTIEPIANLKTYSNGKYGFSFAYPKNWKINGIAGQDGPRISLTNIADGHTISITVWRVTGFGYCYNYGERKEIFVGGKAAETADGIGGSEMCEKPEELINRGNTFVLIPIDDSDTTFPRNQIHIDYDYPLDEINLAKSNLDQILSSFKFTK